MADGCLLCYITDRTAFAPDEPTRRRRLLEKIAEAARAGIDHIQLREKDLSTQELESLARKAVQIVDKARTLAPDPSLLTPALLINSRTDVAIAAGADGVHLRSDDISPLEVSGIWRKNQVETAALACPERSRNGYPAPRGALSAAPDAPLLGMSCHSPEDVNRAAANGASFAVFAPVFEKKDGPASRSAGLSQLREACKAKIPVLALGGVTLSNARQCLEAGAAGIAAIRLFQENEIASAVAQLRTL